MEGLLKYVTRYRILRLKVCEVIQKWQNPILNTIYSVLNSPVVELDRATFINHIRSRMRATYLLAHLLTYSVLTSFDKQFFSWENDTMDDREQSKFGDK
jgi:hypothetical protein